MTHTLFLAIVCLTIYFYYLLPTEWQYRPGGDLSNSYQIVISVVVGLLPLPHVYRELLEPASIDRVLMSDLCVRHICSIAELSGNILIWH